MVALPRIVIAAPASGHGKTTVAVGVMAALSARGLQVSGHKVGPDYIDPGYHALATGRPGRNLDPFLVGTHRVAPLLAHGAAGADVAIVEGVMGLYDGQLGTDGFASTAHVAALTASPVLLVVDVSHASRSIAAVVHGMRTFDPGVRLVGVVLNKAGSPRHAREVTDALDATGLPVLGVLGRDDGIVAPSRHLGLVPAAERAGAAAELDVLADQIEAGLDLDALLELARAAPELDAAPWDPFAEVRAPHGDRPGTGAAAPDGSRPLVALAGGRAFTFRYAETEELLRAAGCDTVVLDPRTDRELPAGVRGLYLGGGFPEVYAGDLAGNHRLRAEVRDAVGAGLPTVAECAGLLYLCRSLDGRPMVGALPADAAMTPRLSLGYRTAVVPADGLAGPAGTRLHGHEFHRTALTPSAGASPAFLLDGRADGVGSATLTASYLHLHWAGQPQLAQRFAAAARAFGRTAVDRPPLPSSGTAPSANAPAQVTGTPVPDAIAPLAGAGAPVADGTPRVSGVAGVAEAAGAAEVVEAVDAAALADSVAVAAFAAGAGTVGEVVLVGAGPGDPGLVTVAGKAALAAADVVLADRLVPVEALSWLRPGAEIVDVAKHPGGPATTQEQINRLLVAHARAGRRVVRLKGGDSFVFGRGGEEVLACAEAGVPVRVVPGVTSSIAVPALVGIPVTHRGRTQGFTVVSGHVPPGHPDSTVDFAALAAVGTTIVVLMGVRTLGAITAALVAAGLDPATPAAVVADGGLPAQRVETGTVATIATVAAEAGIGPPAVTVIGAVAGFAATATDATARD